MFDTLSDRLEGILGRLRSRGRLSDSDVDESLREIRTALLEADVDVGVARSLVDGIRMRLVGQDLSKSLSPGQQVVKAVHEELVRVLGGESLRLTFASSPPTVVLLAGLQGSGKTTTAAKLAKWFRQQGRNPMLVGADLQRPAAVEQLRILAEQVGVPVYSEPTDPVAVARAGKGEAERQAALPIEPFSDDLGIGGRGLTHRHNPRNREQQKQHCGRSREQRNRRGRQRE